MRSALYSVRKAPAVMPYAGRDDFDHARQDPAGFNYLAEHEGKFDDPDGRDDVASL